MATEPVEDDAVSDSSSLSDYKRSFFQLVTRVKATTDQFCTDSNTFELDIHCLQNEDEDSIVLQGTLELHPKLIVNVTSLSFYGEQVGAFSAVINDPPFKFVHEIDLESYKGLVRFYVDPTESLIFGIDVNTTSGTQLKTLKRVAYVH